MWSNNKFINISVNILIYLMSMYFLHLGQFCLPIACLLLYIDNKFNVNNLKTFIILCLFGVSFFIFSRSVGFYSVMGLTLPMAYYIGSNLKDKSEESVKKIIYIVVLGMATHLLLNFSMDIQNAGLGVFKSYYSHFDFWLRDWDMPTTIAVNYVIPIGCVYYVFVLENNKKAKIISTILFILLLLYDFSLGRRTPILMVGVSVFVSLILDIFVLNKRKKLPKKLLTVLGIIILLVIAFVLMLNLNIFGLGEKLRYVMLIDKFIWLGFDAERIELFITALKLAPEHLWGGAEISAIMDDPIHDLWSDTFDYGGIVSYILLMSYTVLYLKNIFVLYKNKNIANNFKVLVLTIFVCITIQCLLEPVMSGSSIFLICIVLIGSLLEGLNCYE